MNRLNSTCVFVLFGTNASVALLVVRVCSEYKNNIYFDNIIKMMSSTILNE